MLHLYFEHTSMLRLIINSYYIEEYFFFFFNRISFNFLRNRIVHFTRNSNSAHTYRSHVITLFYILYLHEVSAKRVNLTRSPFHRFLMIFSSRCVNRLRPTLSKPTAFFMIYAWYNIHKDGKIVTSKKNTLHWKCTVKRGLSTFYVFRFLRNIVKLFNAKRKKKIFSLNRVKIG